MKKILFVILCMGLAPFSANATVYDVHSPSLYGGGGGPGTGRAQGIHADLGFSVSGIGFYGDLMSQSFDIVIYSSTDGHSAGGILASAADVVGGTGLGWNDIAINFNFLVGNYYVVNWRPTNGNSSWGTPQYYYDNALPVTEGPITLVEGFEGFSAESVGNSLHPRMRYTTTDVSAPGMLGLFALGLGGFALRRRKTC